MPKKPVRRKKHAPRNKKAAVKIADVMHAVPPKAPRPKTSWQVVVDFLRSLRG